MGGRMDDMIRGGVTLPQLTLPQVASLCAEPDRECDDQSPYLSSQNADLLRGLSRRLGNAKSSTIKYLTGRDSNGKFVPAVELRSRTKVLSNAKQMVRYTRNGEGTSLLILRMHICIHLFCIVAESALYLHTICTQSEIASQNVSQKCITIFSC